MGVTATTGVDLVGVVVLGVSATTGVDLVGVIVLLGTLIPFFKDKDLVKITINKAKNKKLIVFI